VRVAVRPTLFFFTSVQKSTKTNMKLFSKIAENIAPGRKV
jgi:hypothetical protein